MAAVHPSVWPILGGGLLMVWVLIRRFRYTVGPQPLDAGGRRRLLIRSLLILGILLIATSLVSHTPLSYGAGMAGLLIGAGLAYWSLHHTRFEQGEAGEAVRYLPNVWIGSAVFGLFVLRLLWRVVPIVLGHQFYNSAGTSFDPSQFNASSFTSGSPLTYALFAVFIAYQIAYALGVLRQTRALSTL